MTIDLCPDHLVRHVMLCATCEQVIARIGTASGWKETTGLKPELFTYPDRPEFWTGAQHVVNFSLVQSVQYGCYICNPLLAAFPHQEKPRAPHARTFYQICCDDQERWIIRFIIELPRTNLLPAQMIECHGVFKILHPNGKLRS